MGLRGCLASGSKFFGIDKNVFLSQHSNSNGINVCILRPLKWNLKAYRGIFMCLERCLTLGIDGCEYF